MFASQTGSYRSERHPGTNASRSFDESNPLFRLIAELATLRRSHDALKHGPQIVRNYVETPGLFAVSRLDTASGQEIVVAFNTATTALTANIEIRPDSQKFGSLHGACEASAAAPGSYKVTLPPLDFIVCATSASR